MLVADSDMYDKKCCNTSTLLV